MLYCCTRSSPPGLRNLNFNQIRVNCTERPEPPTRMPHWFYGGVCVPEGSSIMAYRDYIHTPVTPRDIRWGLQQGAVAGIVAGLVFAAFEMTASAFMMGADAFFMPLRMIGAIALGPEALDPGYSLLTASIAGVIVHMILAIIYGIVFGEIASMLRGSAAFIGLGSVFGLALWLVNFYVIAPIAFPWFL
ncbi:hypothetical protein, partial [Mesorhizobium sp. M6A.T.Cr.TU.017.01.1.1]|uniref:hypothetical protein n=1 Tax=Mesorhizobium sp. M6A.T.Cr.TU.017.01.1.1 TaxID=2496774 RepID=UPI001FDFD58E